MFKRLFLILLLFIPNTLILNPVFGDNAPTINCVGLPGCPDTDKSVPSDPDISKMSFLEWISGAIGELIQYVAVIAVITLIISGILYMISGGEEEKTNKAKKWIIRSLVGVFLSISAWGIINIINEIKIQ